MTTRSGPAGLLHGVRVIVALAGVNLRRTVRERVALFFLFVFPMVMILVLGLAFGGAFTPRVGVVVEQRGPLATALLDRLTDAGGVTVRQVTSERSLRAAVERGELEAGLIIGRGYDAAVRSGGQAVVTSLVRSDRQGQQVAQLVSTAVDEESGRLRAARYTAGRQATSFDAALGAVDSAAQRVAAVSVSVAVVGGDATSATAGRFDTGASSQLLLFLFLTALTGSAALIETRRLGVSRRMLSTPAPTATIIAGEAVGRLVVSVLQGIAIMAASALLFGVRWGNLVAAGLLMTVFAAVAGGAGLLMGATARTPEQSLAFGLLLSLGFGALGGTMLPLDLFPSTMRTLAHLTPHAWGVEGFTELINHHGGVTDIAPQLGVLAAMAAVLFALATWRLRRAVS